MLKTSKRVATFYMSIVIVFILYITVVLIHFFTEDSITKEMIVGVNPVAEVTSTMREQESLAIDIENKKIEPSIQETQESNSRNIEQTTRSQKVREENKKTVSIEAKVTQKEQREDEKKEVEKETTMEEIEQQPEKVQNSILTQYKGFPTVGKIEIPKTGVDIPILNQVTVEGMNNAPCLLYGTGELNQNGNNLIVGHNFRNGTIFSNNKNLQLGDSIYVTTLDGNRVEYKIYNKFVTTAEDVSYIKRDTNNKPEITLSCCTDDDKDRIIILAKI